MSRRLKQAAVVFVVALAAAQLIRPGRANPPTDATRTIQAHETTKGLAAVLDRSCGDCHSSATAWPSWYTQIAPLSWLMAHEVTEGRKTVNFSEWAAYSAAQQRMLLAASCDDAKSGKMPGPYTFFKPETRLSAQDVETICAAAHDTEAKAAGASQ
jgi:heme-binding protein